MRLLGIVHVAVDNEQRAIAVGAPKSSLENLINELRQRGIKIHEFHEVGAVHTPYMNEAANNLKQLVDSENFRDKFVNPRIGLIGNYSASLVTDAKGIIAEVYNQLNNLVKWRESIAFMSKNLEIRKVLVVGLDKKKYLEKILMANVENFYVMTVNSIDSL